MLLYSKHADVSNIISNNYLLCRYMINFRAVYNMNKIIAILCEIPETCCNKYCSTCNTAVLKTIAYTPR